MKSNISILMPTIYFPPRVGGIESHVYYLARELVRRGHEVEVITTRTERRSPGYEVIGGIKVHRLVSFGKHFIGWSLSSILSAPEVVLRARRHDILHCHTFAFALGGSVASYILKRPLVVTVHSSHFLRLSRNAVMSGVMRALLAKACCLMSTSKEIDMVVRGLLPDHFTQPIVNGIDTEKFRPAQPVLEKDADEFLIVCPRRLVEKNGVEFLIRALAVVRDVKARLYIAGDGPLRGRLEALAAEIGVRDRVVFMGSVDNTKMPSVYSSADLVVIPSLLEATSIAALEAMACAKVVAASRVGGLPEIIDDRVGILFEPGSARAIAGAIQNIAARPDTAGMGREARRRVEENWGIGRIAEIHEELYEKVIKESADA